MSGIWEVYLWRVIGKNIRNNSGNCLIVGIDLYFPSHMIDLVYIWYGDRYWPKVLFTTITSTAYDLKAKVTDLELQAIVASLRVLFKNLF